MVGRSRVNLRRHCQTSELQAEENRLLSSLKEHSPAFLIVGFPSIRTEK
jgi:hypothetical protein